MVQYDFVVDGERRHGHSDVDVAYDGRKLKTYWDVDLENVEVGEIKALLVKLAKCPQCGVPWWFNFSNAKICSCCANTILKAGTSEAQEFTRKELQLIMHALMLATKDCPSKPTQGDPMAQSDAVAAFEAGIAPLENSLYQAGFADGVASVGSPGSGVSPAQEQLDIAAAVKAASDPLNAQISSLQLAKQTEDALLAQVQSSLQTVVALFNPPVPPPAS